MAPYPLACTAYLLLLCTVHLFVVPTSGYSDIARWKHHAFLVLSATFLIITLCIMVDRWLDGHKPALRTQLQTRDLPFALYLLFTALSALFSEYPGVFLGNSRMEGLLVIILYVCTAVLLSHHFVPAPWMPYLLGTVTTLFCLFGLVQFWGANPLSLYPEGYNFYGADVYYMGKYWSTAGNSGLCVALLVMSAGLFAVYMIRGSIHRRLAAVPLFLVVFCILELEGEAGLLSLLVCTPLLLPLCVRSFRELSHSAELLAIMATAAGCAQLLVFGERTIRLSISAGILPFVAALLCIIAAWLFSKARFPISAAVLQRILALVVVLLFVTAFLTLALYDGLPAGFLQEAQQLLRGNWDDDFGSGRLYIWRNVWSLAKEAPLFGGGPDTLGLRGLAWRPTMHPVLGIDIITEIDAAHNELLHILVNQGALALLAYLWLIVQALITWWRNRNDLCCLMCGAAVLFYFLQSLFGISSPVSAPYYWLALGCLMASKKQKGRP